MGDIAYLRLEKPSSVSREHNTREIIPDYVRVDLMPQNKYYFFDDKMNIITSSHKTHKELDIELKQLYKESTGQKIQKNMNTLMEGLFLFSDKNTDEEILKSVVDFGRNFNVKIIELHLHRDEGYYNKNQEWIPNLHGHFVFENIERNEVLVMQKKRKGKDKGKEELVNLKGKTHKFSRTDTSKMQDFFAKALNLQRGNTNSREHLTHIEWKNKKIKEENLIIEKELEQKKKEIKTKKEALTPNQKIEDLKDNTWLGGKWNQDKIQNLLDTHQIYLSENKELRDKITNLIREIKEKEQEYEEKLSQKNREIQRLKSEKNQKDSEIKTLKESLDRKHKEGIGLVYNENIRKQYLEQIGKDIDKKIRESIESKMCDENVVSPMFIDENIREVMSYFSPNANIWLVLRETLGEDYENNLLKEYEIIIQKIKEERRQKQIIKTEIENKEEQRSRRMRR